MFSPIYFVYLLFIFSCCGLDRVGTNVWTTMRPTTRRAGNTCTSEQYLCQNGKCINRKFVCDGDDDCNDRSDENICRVGVCDDAALFKCKSNGACISVIKVCDGTVICPNGEDEESCGPGTCNHPGLFKCTNGLCISKRSVCNGVSDCNDGSDENRCAIPSDTFPGVNESLPRGISWLKSKRNKRWGWDENTHRAIVALYLSDGATFNGTKEEDELMAKQLELEVVLALYRNETVPVSPNQMALYINAILVTCHNPRNFHGFDLVDLLKQIIQFKENSTHPVVYAALCNANETVSPEAIQYLLSILDHESEYLFWTDIQAMTVIALSCYRKRGQYSDLIGNITSATTNFKKQQRRDGSFGNVYTSAWVVQALLASDNEKDRNWDSEGAIKFLQSKQSAKDNYSFGDFLATYLVLPVLRGKTLADIAKVKCENLRRYSRDENSVLNLKNHRGPSVYVLYSLYIGDDMKVLHPVSLKVAVNITVHDVMNLAVEADPKYKYESKNTSEGLYIYSISGIANDLETGMFWLLHMGKMNDTKATLQTESPDKIYIKGNEHIIMWYKTADIQY